MAPMLGNLSDPLNEEIFLEFGRYEIDHDGFGGFQPIRCVRNARYKLVINLLCTDELYDMQADPDETGNLIENSEHSAIRDALHDKLIDWMNTTRDPFHDWETIGFSAKQANRQTRNFIERIDQLLPDSAQSQMEQTIHDTIANRRRTLTQLLMS